MIFIESLQPVGHQIHFLRTDPSFSGFMNRHYMFSRSCVCQSGFYIKLKQYKSYLYMEREMGGRDGEMEQKRKREGDGDGETGKPVSPKPAGVPCIWKPGEDLMLGLQFKGLPAGRIPEPFLLQRSLSAL